MLNDNEHLSDRYFLRHLKTPRSSLLLIPMIGMVIFIVLYIKAAMVYPGGSAIYPDQIGFNFWNNYLCDLLDEYALNGELNESRTYARWALTVLCASLMILWFYLPNLFAKKSLNQHIMWFSGLISLSVVFFMATQNHDQVVRVAGVFGVIAFISCSRELFKADYIRTSVLGIICLIIFLINYFIYETGVYIKVLPSIQKVTFAACLLWFLILANSLHSKIKRNTTLTDSEIDPK